MRSVPRVLQGPYTAAVRLSLQEASQAQQDGDQARLSRAWKLFLLLPRMLLWRPPRGGLVPKRHLESRLRLFVAGEWTELLQQGAVHGAAAVAAFARKRRREHGEEDLSRRAARAVRQVELGEISAGRQALEGESVAPGTLRTLWALTDPERRPEVPREPLLPELSHHVPRVVLDSELCTTNLRKSRRGAAGGPSGMTAEHLKGLLESEDDSSLLAELANSLAQADVSSDIVRALRLGRITALQKPDNGVRGIVVGEFIRRLVARTVAKHSLPVRIGNPRRVRVRGTCHPSIDGPRRQRHSCVCGWGGAFDLISRNSMLSGLMHEGR